ncbi:MAG: hypothetical protein WKF47_18845 [Geodermatophilaceae bacterium]
MWSAADERFPRGYQDDADPLDVNSWGALFLHPAGRDDLAAGALAHTAAFASTDAGLTGHRAWYPQPAFPAAPSAVWCEGSAGVGLARLRLGDSAGCRAILATLTAGQSADGAFRYATRDDAPTGMTTTESVTATAWYVLLSAAPTGPSVWD